MKSETIATLAADAKRRAREKGRLRDRSFYLGYFAVVVSSRPALADQREAFLSTVGLKEAL